VEAVAALRDELDGRSASSGAAFVDRHLERVSSTGGLIGANSRISTSAAAAFSLAGVMRPEVIVFLGSGFESPAGGSVDRLRADGGGRTSASGGPRLARAVSCIFHPLFSI
jgi:hypothetical protein